MSIGVTVTFDGNGADTVEPASKFIEYPALMYGDLAVATRAGYIFDGWFSAAVGGVEVFAESEVQSWEGHTLYAHWAEACTVTLDGNGGGTPSPSSLVVAVGGSYGTSLTDAVVTREGYAFAGWYTAASGGDLVYAASVVPAEAHTLYAHWNVIFAVTLDGNGGDSPSPATLDYSTPGSLYGAGLTAATVTRAGYIFDGWYTAADGGVLVTAASAVSPFSAHTLYAHWSEFITVTLSGNGGSVVSPASFTLTDKGAYGDSLTSAVVTREGYTFSGWYTAAIGGTLVTAASVPAVWESHTLYAGWDCEYFELTEDGLWVYIDPVIVGKNLPPGLQAWFDLWLTAAGRAERLAFVVRGVVSDFRTATAADQDSVGALDASLVKVGLLTVVKSTIWYNLAIECGYASASTFAAGWSDAQVYLRRLMVDLRLGNNIHASGSGTPLYGAPSRSSRSSGSGSSTIGVPNVGSSGGGSYSGPINLGMGMG